MSHRYRQKWRYTVISAIRQNEVFMWQERLGSDADFIVFRCLHVDIESAEIWSWPKTRSELYNAFIVANLWTDIPYSEPSLCCFCGIFYDICFVHILSEYTVTADLKSCFVECIQNEISQHAGTVLRNASNLNFSIAVLSGNVASLNNETHELFKELAFYYCRQCAQALDTRL